jgi:hypothetical protein
MVGKSCCPQSFARTLGLFTLTPSQIVQLCQTLEGDPAHLSGGDIDTLLLETLERQFQSLELDERILTTLC